MSTALTEEPEKWIADAKKLLVAVLVKGLSGYIVCDDVDGKNWFDERNRLLKP